MAALVNDTITFYANASSDSGAPLIFTIYYDYYQDPVPTPNPEGYVTVDTTGSPGSVVHTYAYDHPGNITFGNKLVFYVQLFVDDGTDIAQASIQVAVSPPPVNTPPTFESLPPVPLTLNIGATQNLQIRIADANSDTVHVFWDFGDGTNATNVTVAPPAPGVVLIQPHSWNPHIPGVGDYNKTYVLTMSLSDGLHPPVNASIDVTIIVPPNRSPVIIDPGILASKVFANTSEPVNFTISAYDPDGDSLIWTFNYSDGSVVVYHTGFTQPGMLIWQNTTHSFTTNRTYMVNVSVSDHVHNGTVSTTLHIISNAPPFVSDKISVSPDDPIVNSTTGYVNAILSIQADDPDGDWFNVTWDMGVFGIRTNISSDDFATRKSPDWFRQTLTFNKTGPYPVTVTVTDGRLGHEVRLTKVVNVSSHNQRPVVWEFFQSYVKGDFALANQTVNFTLIFTDNERDSINLTWDFGDGSPRLPMYLTNYDANGNITVNVNHSYAKLGNYNVTILLTDNKIGGFNHTLNYTLHILVSVPRVILSGGWDWWDYSSLALFMMIPIGCVAWVIMNRRQRKSIEDQGMTYDEWKIRKEMDSKELSK
jgi:hypothetical protein